MKSKFLENYSTENTEVEVKAEIVKSKSPSLKEHNKPSKNHIPPKIKKGDFSNSIFPLFNKNIFFNYLIHHCYLRF